MQFFKTYTLLRNLTAHLMIEMGLSVSFGPCGQSEDSALTSCLLRIIESTHCLKYTKGQKMSDKSCRASTAAEQQGTD